MSDGFFFGRPARHDPTKAEEHLDALDLEETVRLSLRFTGFVQGVGFRYTQHTIAQRLGVTGWVKNMDDGSVAAEWQGTGAQVKRMLAKMRDYYGAYGNAFSVVRADEVATLPDEQGFEVRF